MAQRAFECQDCCERFQTGDELLKHVQSYQARIRPLLPLFNKVLSLLAHREPDSGRETEFDDDDDTEEDYGRPVSLRGSRLNCPHPVCGRRFNRRQELRRHYGMHCKCNETCPSCSNTYVEASRFMSHKCCRESSISPQLKGQRDKLRKRIEGELDKLLQANGTIHANVNRKHDKRKASLARTTAGQYATLGTGESHDPISNDYLPHSPEFLLLPQTLPTLSQWPEAPATHHEASRFYQPLLSTLFEQSAGSEQRLVSAPHMAWHRFETESIFDPSFRDESWGASCYPDQAGSLEGGCRQP